MERMIIVIIIIKEKRLGVEWGGDGVLIIWDEVGGRGGDNFGRCLRRICK